MESTEVPPEEGFVRLRIEEDSEGSDDETVTYDGHYLSPRAMSSDGSLAVALLSAPLLSKRPARGTARTFLRGDAPADAATVTGSRCQSQAMRGLALGPEEEHAYTAAELTQCAPTNKCDRQPIVAPSSTAQVSCRLLEPLFRGSMANSSCRKG